MLGVEGLLGGVSHLEEDVVGIEEDVEVDEAEEGVTGVGGRMAEGEGEDSYSKHGNARNFVCILFGYDARFVWTCPLGPP